jgi:hypothetical protein
MKMRSRTQLAIGGGLALLSVVFLAFYAPYYSTIFFWELRKLLFWLVPLLIIIGVGFGVVVCLELFGAGIESLMSMVLIGALVLSSLTGLIWYGASYHNYLQAKQYVSSVRVISGSVPSFNQRAPYQIAVAQARPNLGDSPGDIADTSYLAGSDKFTTLVKRRGLLSGYQTLLSQQIPLTGRGSGSSCDFDGDGADARISGFFAHNLGRKISKERRWVRFTGEDTYGYCDGATPKVVVPLKRQVGIFTVTERAAGVAIYDGKTGKITFSRTAKDIPGPAYPLSLAAKQRESTHALGSYGDWFFGRAGWDTTDDDVNSGNNSEFTLGTDRGTTVYATPLRRRGSATSISVISTISAAVDGGGLARFTVHRLRPSWVSASAIETRIKADYQDIPNWQNLRIFEIVPTSERTWVATIGNSQNVLYRVTGTGDLSGDNATCLQRADGTQIRCGTLADTDQRGVGTQYGDRDQPGGVPDDVGSLSNEELLELQRRINDEAGKRLSEQGG